MKVELADVWVGDKEEEFGDMDDVCLPSQVLKNLLKIKFIFRI